MDSCLVAGRQGFGTRGPESCSRTFVRFRTLCFCRFVCDALVLFGPFRGALAQRVSSRLSPPLAIRDQSKPKSRPWLPLGGRDHARRTKVLWPRLFLTM